MHQGTSRVLVTCPTFEPGFRGGGPIRSVARIIDTAPENLDVRLVTSDRDIGSREPYPSLSGRTVPRGQSTVTYLNKHNPIQWLRMIRDIRRRPIDLLYLNSLWEPWFSQLPLLLAAIRVIPVRVVLIAPRGELSAGALALKARKKRAFIHFLAWLLRRVEMRWHASTRLEVDDILGVFPGTARQIILVSVDLTGSQMNSVAHIEPRTGPPRFVFIGRVSPKKNLDLAIDALARVPVQVSFDIYGPVEDRRYWSACLDKIAALPDHITVAYRGELTPNKVPSTFASYDAFVFPTRGENFGHVIAESLAASCPVICSDHTPWTPVLNAGGGVVVHELSKSALGADLAAWAAKSPIARADARNAARAAFLIWYGQQDRANILELAICEIGSGR
jgi:glycosyltransferase involved in cell wall biosynthesis